MQTTFTGNPPMPVLMRMVAEFTLAARRDMGDAGTATTPLEVFAPKIDDLFGDELDAYEALTLPLDALFRKHGWAAPWTTRRPART